MYFFTQLMCFDSNVFIRVSICNISIYKCCINIMTSAINLIFYSKHCMPNESSFRKLPDHLLHI